MPFVEKSSEFLPMPPQHTIKDSPAFTATFGWSGRETEETHQLCGETMVIMTRGCHPEYGSFVGIEFVPAPKPDHVVDS